MAIENIKAKLDPQTRVARVNASLYPEVREMARQLGDGNVSRGLTLAVLESMERRQRAKN